jgi:hypothetical protein
MGGTVAETIRRENGEIIKMARRTGAYNWMIFSKEFNVGEIDKAIDEHLKMFMEMKEDYEHGEPYKHPMSPVYGWCNHLAPVDYGLVVLDFQKKKIHSMQGYDSPGKLSLISMPHNDKETMEIYDFLMQNNLLDVCKYDFTRLGDVHSIFGSKEPFKIALKELNNSYLDGIKSIFGQYNTSHIDMVFVPKILKNFELHSYEESPEGLVKMLSALKNDGFTFNEEEIKMWKEHYDDPDYVGGYGGKLTDKEMDDLTEEAYEQYAKECLSLLHNDIDNIVADKSVKIKP